MKGKITKIKDLLQYIEWEGFGYFLFDYASPDFISEESDNECLEFKKYWKNLIRESMELKEIVKSNFYF